MKVVDHARKMKQTRLFFQLAVLSTNSILGIEAFQPQALLPARLRLLSSSSRRSAAPNWDIVKSNPRARIFARSSILQTARCVTTASAALNKDFNKQQNLEIAAR